MSVLMSTSALEHLWSVGVSKHTSRLPCMSGAAIRRLYLELCDASHFAQLVAFRSRLGYGRPGRLRVLVLLFTQLLKRGKSSTCLLIGGCVLSCTRLWLLYEDTKILMSCTSHAILHSSFVKQAWKTGHIPIIFLSIINNTFFPFLKAPCPCVSVQLDMEIPAVSYILSVFESLLLQTVQCIFHPQMPQIRQLRCTQD